MTRAVLWVVPLVGAVSAVLAGEVGASAWLVGIVVGGVAAAFLWSFQVGRIRRVARQLNRWAGDETSIPLALTGGPQWRELGTAVNALGAELRDTRDALGVLDPWGVRLVAALELPALLFGPDARLLAANEAAGRLFGPGDGDAGSPVRVLGSGTLAAAVDHARTSEVPVRVTATVGERDLAATATRLDDHVLLVVADRSAQRRVEELRRDFVTNASHELKTPVTAIATLVGALRLVDGERAERMLGQLEGESERLVRLVHDLLDLRRVDGGSTEDEMAPIDLVPLVRQGTAHVRSAADTAEVAVITRLPEAAVVVGRRADLQLVVDNLLGNAVKYNRVGGQVTVTLSADGGAQVLSFRDTGIGIPRNEVARIFERFYRVDVARSRDTGGTGLGLSIVRHVVEGHGGTIEVDSLLGAGTTFTVRLPVSPGSVLAPSRDREDAGRS